MNFEQLGVDQRILSGLKHLEVERPTPIQAKSIAVGLNRLDFIGLAPTGTGKTFAYLIPMLQWVFHAKITHSHPSVLILVPTRELAIQVEQNISALSKFTQIFAVSIFSGERENKQIRKLEELTDIIIATPGRLIKFHEQELIILDKIGTLIIDEVDRMFDMGFQRDLEYILNKLPHKNKRHNMFVASTLPNTLEIFLKTIMNTPKIIDVGRAVLPSKIKHELYQTTDAEKFDILREILQTENIVAALIFTQSKENARITTRNLIKNEFDSEEFHGGLTQRQRSIALNNFKSGAVNLIVCTDVAARGIDVMDISHVIHMDIPRNFEDYLHRAGRTGRMNKSGKSIMIASSRESNNVKNIEKRLQSKLYKHTKSKRDNQSRKFSSSSRKPYTKKKPQYKSRRKRRKL